MPRLYFGRNLESEPRDALTESHHSLDVKTANVTIRQRTSNIDLELSSNETVKSVFSHDEAALKERVRPSVCHALVALLLFGLLGATIGRIYATASLPACREVDCGRIGGPT